MFVVSSAKLACNYWLQATSFELLAKPDYRLLPTGYFTYNGHCLLPTSYKL